MKKIVYLLYFILLVSCTILKNGVSYTGEDKIFSKQLYGFPTYVRQAQGREPGWELGFAFKTNKAARLKGVWLKNPTLGAVPVSLWDGESKQLIKTFLFTNADSSSYNHFILLQPIILTAQKKYCITTNVTQYYYHTLPFAILPMQANNCTLLSSVYEETYYQRYPQFEINNVLHGLLDIDVDFKQ